MKRDLMAESTADNRSLKPTAEAAGVKIGIDPKGLRPSRRSTRPDRRLAPRCHPAHKAHAPCDFTLEPRTLLATLQAATEVFRAVPLLESQATSALSSGNDQANFRTVSDIKLNIPPSSDDGLAPGALALADLNGDGILDMAVANRLNNTVNVYMGLGNGQFAPELNGGAGFATGRGPVSVSVADLNGDGRADLIVADEGSDEVSILLNIPSGNGDLGPGLPAQGITFASAPPLKVGLNPTSAVFVDDGPGQGYLAVGNSGSDDVMIFTFAGNGAFDESPSQVIPLGHSPAIVVSMTWEGGPALVSLDSAGNFITLITGLGEPDPHTQTVDSGGIHPVAAEGFAAGSASGLIVANSGDGSVVLFTKSSDGLAMQSKFFSPLVQAMASQSLAGVREVGVLVFTAGAGAGGSSLVGVRLVGQTSNPNADALLVLNPQQQLQPLRQSDLTLVSTLLPVSVAIKPTLAGPTIALQASFASSADVTNAINPSGRGNAVDEDSVLASGGPFSAEAAFTPMTDFIAASAPEPAGSPWENYVSGVDTAIEQIHQEALDRMVTSPSAAETSAAPSRATTAGELTGSLTLDSLDDSDYMLTCASRNSIMLMVRLRAGPIGIQSSSVSTSGAPDAECGAAVLDRVEARLLDPPGVGSSTEHDAPERRSPSISIVLAVAAISPLVLTQWLRAFANRRVGQRICRKRDHAVSI